ncbi:MAG TPA: PilZ domain-containing protein [Anaeromyxobacter sp.]|nr:PilZ domain-containing protein [Anaeromyxobacter sp.]
MAAVPQQTRRAPRVPARCSTEVRFGAGRWTGLTEDLGPGGCRIVARIALRPGEPVSLKLRFGGVRQALEIVGTVAWTAAKAPWTTGVAFARGQEEKARRFVKAVLASAPELAAAQDAEGGYRSGRPAPVARPEPAARPAPAGPPGAEARPAPAAGALVAPPEPPLAAPNPRVAALLLSARALAAAGSREEAIRSLREALELDPGNFRAVALLTVLGARDG